MYIILVTTSVYIELNLELKRNSKHLSICHRNLNIVSGHNYTKTKIFNFLGFSETYLDFSTVPNDGNLEISRYILVRTGHTLNSKRDDDWN